MDKRWIWPFELEEQIGSGAMGQVYRARYVKNDRRVALKLLPADVAANATLAARFAREMEVLKDLRHPNIVHCFGGTTEGEQQFYAMELVEGGTVADLLHQQGKLTWEQTVDIGVQVCAALAYAHEQGVIHRDLKPANLLIAKGGKIKLSDFGLAQLAAETRLTAAGKTAGTLHYMAPEQITGKPPISPKTDLYALGCVLFELLTGQPPFTGEAMAEILQRHCRETPERVSSLVLDCPPALDLIVSDLLEKSPERRPADASEVARRLKEVSTSVTLKSPKYNRNLPTTARPPQTETVEAPIARGRAPWWLIVAFAATLVWAVWATNAALRKTVPFSAERVATLTEGLKNENPIIRAYAARVLGGIGPPAQATIPDLLTVLGDTDLSVRLEAIKAIGAVGHSDAELVARLRSFEKTEEIPQVRDATAKAIEQLKGRSADSHTGWYVFGGIAAVLAMGGTWVWRRAMRAMPVATGR